MKVVAPCAENTLNGAESILNALLMTHFYENLLQVGFHIMTNINLAAIYGG